VKEGKKRKGKEKKPFLEEPIPSCCRFSPAGGKKKKKKKKRGGGGRKRKTMHNAFSRVSTKKNGRASPDSRLSAEEGRKKKEVNCRLS